MKRRRMLEAAVFAATLAAVPAAAATKLADPIPAPIEASDVTVALETVASGLVAPVAATFAPHRRDKLYVVDQTGPIWAVDLSDDDDDGKGALPRRILFADLSSRLVPLGLFGIHYDERGLLGLAFHPHFKKNGLLYTFSSEPVKGQADFSTQPPGVPANCHSVVTEWRVFDPKDDDATVDPASARELMRIDKPQFNHNGGALAFGPDGMLYISIGDGGAADDQGVGHAPGGNGQSLAPGNLLGKILRIDPLGKNSANGRYGIPRDNPFRGAGVDEVFAYGFRNPFRISFDRRTGDLYVADVGQNDIEEVDVVRAGGNYGWPIKEGTFLFDANGTAPGFVFADSPGAPAGLADPIAEYDHASLVAGVPEGIAAVGGFVYRGHEIRELRGHYVFGDYSRAFAQPQGRLLVLQPGRCGSVPRCVEELRIAGMPTLGWAVLGFGEDARGELYLLANRTGVVFDTTGAVLRITPVDRDRDGF
jgi:glucose/arabinose dehydrogenase